MNTLWIVLAIILALLIIVGIIVIVGNNRKKSKTVSFDKKDETQPKQLTQQEKSGNYQAKGGFNFAPANAPEKQPEPVHRAEPVAPADKPAPQEIRELDKQPKVADEPRDTRAGGTGAAVAGGVAAAGATGVAASLHDDSPAKADTTKPEAEKAEATNAAVADQPAQPAKPEESTPVTEDLSDEEPQPVADSEFSEPVNDGPTENEPELKEQDDTVQPASEAPAAAETDKVDTVAQDTTIADEPETPAEPVKQAAPVAPVAPEAPEAPVETQRAEPEAVAEQAEPEAAAPAAAVPAEAEAETPAEESPLFDDLAEERSADPANEVDVEDKISRVEEQQDSLSTEEEAQEAAEAAAVTADGAEAAREQTPAPTGEPTPAPTPEEPVEEIAPAAGRIGRLRGRLSRSQNAIGQGLLGILTAGDLDEDAWEEIEDTLIMADLGAELTMKVTDSLRDKIAERGVSNEEEARAMLRETLIDAGRPDMDRSIKAMPVDGKPAVILVVGVNGTGKTTTTGKLARVLVSMGHRVLLGAADTFRAAAADQLETWGRRVGATTVRGKEGADPASVAFDAVARGVEEQADVVLIDTAGRLHTATGLMDQLGKVKRVVEKKSQVDEVLLVLDATVGQNGLTQARVFRDVVDITGVVLTKLDGTAKGGIVFQVQEELGVPVKLVGLGEGADDLAPFEVEGFVDALLG